MAKSEVLKAIIDIDVKGAKESISQLDKIADSFDSQRLKAQTNDLKAQLGELFKYLEKVGTEEIEFNFKDSNLKDNIRKLANFIDANFTNKLDSSVQEQIKSIEEQMGIAAQKAAEYGHRAKQLFDEIALEKKKLEAKAETGHFGFEIDPSLVENIKSLNRHITSVGDEINRLKGKEKNEKERLQLINLEKEQAALKAFSVELEESRKDWRRKGQSRGGLLTQEGKALERKENLGLEKAQIQKSGIPKEVSDLQKSFESLIRVIENLGKVQRAVYSEETKKKIAENKKEVEKTEVAVKKLDKAEVQHEKTLGRKLISGLSYHTIFNKVRQLLNASIRSIEQLDKAMTKAAIVTSMTRQESWHLLKSYQNLAKETGKTTAEIANLNAFFLQQGKTVKQAAEMTEAAAKSAAVAGTSLQDAANYITSAIHGFGLAADQAEFVADKFAALGAASASGFEEIAIAMSKVAPVAQSAGVGIDFMMAVLAKGIHTTREAPEAIGTAMKTIFARMRELTDIGKATEDGMSLNRVEKALNSIGVDLRDVTGQFRDLEDVLMDVGYKWKDLDSVQHAYLATALAGTRQQPRLLAILNDFETTVDFIEISRQSQDELLYQHMDFLSGMEAASNQLKNSWEELTVAIVNSDLLIKIYSSLASVISTLATGVEYMVSQWWLLAPILAIVAGNTMRLLAHNIKALAIKQKEIIQKNIAIAIQKQENRELIKHSALLKNKNVLKKQEAIAEFLAQQQKKGALAIGDQELNQLILAIGVDQAKTQSEKQVAIAKLENLAATYALTNEQRTNIATTIASLAPDRAKEASLKRVAASAMLAQIALAGIAVALGLAVAGIAAMIKSFKKANRSVEELGKSVQESGKKIHDTNKKLNDLNKSVEAFDRLNKKVLKNNEDLEEMRQILDDIENFTDGDREYNFVRTTLTGEREIDRDLVMHYQEELFSRNLSELSKQYKELNQSFKKHGIANTLEDPALRRFMRDQGTTMAEGFIRRIENSDLQHKTKEVVDSYIQNMDLSKFEKFAHMNVTGYAVWDTGVVDIKEFGWIVKEGVDAAKEAWELTKQYDGVIDIYYEEFETGEKYFDWDSYKKHLLQIANIAESSLKSINDLGSEPLYIQLENFSNILEEIKSDNVLTKVLKEGNQEMYHLVAMANTLGLTMKEMDSTFYSLSKRGFSNEDILSLGSVWGMDVAGNTKEYRKEHRETEEKIKKLYDKQLSDTLELEKLNEKETLSAKEKSRKKTLEGRLPTYSTQISVLSDTLEHNLIDTYMSDYTEKNSKDIKRFLSGGIAPEDFAKHRKGLERFLKGKGFSDEEIESKTRQALSAFVLSADEIVDKFKTVGSTVQSALNIDKEIAKGNFSAYFDLIDELGDNAEEILEEFQNTGEIEALTDAIFKNREKELKNSIAYLESLGDDLSPQDKEDLQKFRFMLANLDDITFAQEAWTAALEKTADRLNIIKNNISFLERLKDFNFTVGSNSVFEKMIEEQRNRAEKESQAQMEKAREDRNNELKKLAKAGLVLSDGTINTPKNVTKEQQLMIDNYFKYNDNFLDASNQYLDIIQSQIDRFKKEQEELKKEIEDSHKDRMDILKKQYDEKWAAIDYENKLISLQEKITEARNKMATAMYVGDLAAQVDAQKLMKEARENRQKEIEKEILDRIQKEEEMARDKRIEEINESIETEIKELSKDFKDYLDKFDNSVDIQKTIAENTSETTEEIKSSSGGRSGSGGSDLVRQLSILDGGGGVVR